MSQHVLYRTVKIDGLSIFYREAGPKDAPTILLLHGLPSSSRMFEPLLSRLSDRFHLVAPDYPGFGHSDGPDPKNFAYTFDQNRIEITGHFTEALGLSQYTLYMQDYGGPVGFRMALGAPGARRSSHRSRRGRAQRRPGRELETAARVLGKIARRNEVISEPTCSRSLRRVRAMSGTIRTWIATTLISGPMSLLSESAGPGRDSKRPVLRLSHQCRRLPEMAGMDAREAAAPAGDLG